MLRLRRKLLLPHRALLLALAGGLCFSISVLAEPGRYEPEIDPRIGFNLISWWHFGSRGARTWEAAVQDLYDAGFRDVSINPVRFVDPGSGAISDCRSKCPADAHIAAALRRANDLGMVVTVNPFIEPRDFAFWRAELAFSDAAAERFWTDYERYLIEVAELADRYEAARMTVGTELRALVENPANNTSWAQIIAAVDERFDGGIGYSANWDDYADPNLTAAIWRDARVDFLGVDAYHPLASAEQALGADRPSISELAASWSSILNDADGGYAHGLLSFAAAQGKPLVITEHGVCPRDGASATPYACPGDRPEDAQEQEHAYVALMCAADELKLRPVTEGRLEAIYFWHWAMPGADGSDFALGPATPATASLRGFVSGELRSCEAQ